MSKNGLTELFVIASGFFYSRTTRWFISLGPVPITILCWFRTARSANRPDSPAASVSKPHGSYIPNLRRLRSWTEDGRNKLPLKLLLLRNTLTRWNRVVFGNIFNQKICCLAQLTEAQKALQQQPSQMLESLEFSLRMELEDILAKEELYWKQNLVFHDLKREKETRGFFMQPKSSNDVTILKIKT